MKKMIHPICMFIGAATLVSGLIQVFAPRFVMGFIGAEAHDPAPYFFGIVGMFMALFGALLMNAIYSENKNKLAVFWSALQKLGAFAAITIGLMNGYFNWKAGLVAGFDLLSGFIYLIYWNSIDKQ